MDYYSCPKYLDRFCERHTNKCNWPTKQNIYCQIEEKKPWYKENKIKRLYEIQSILTLFNSFAKLRLFILRVIFSQVTPPERYMLFFLSVSHQCYAVAHTWCVWSTEANHHIIVFLLFGLRSVGALRQNWTTFQ